MNEQSTRGATRRRRLLLAGALLLVAAIFAVATLAFLWPRESRSFDLGSLEQFAPGTVTTYNLRNGVPTLSPDGRVITNEAFHIVRLEDGDVRALSSKDPHLGCAVPWQPDFTFDGRQGWFRNPCHGETYDIAGNHVFGPGPRGLDRFGVEIESGRVIVDLDELTLGPSRARVPSTDDTTPTPAATATPQTSTPHPEPSPAAELPEPIAVPEATGLDVVAQVGGVSRALALVGDLVYLGVGPRVLAVDVSNPSAPTEVARSGVLAGVVESIAPAGQFLFVATGTEIVVLEQPPAGGEQLTTVGRLDLAPHEAVSLHLDGSVLYVGTAVRRRDEAGMPLPFEQSGGAAVLDVSRPEAPNLLALLEIDEPAAGVVLLGDHLVTSARTVIDVSDPARLRVLDAGGGNPPPIREGGERIVYAGRWALDLTNPAAPVAVADFLTPATRVDALLPAGNVMLTMWLACDVGVCRGDVSAAPLSLPGGERAPSTLDDQLAFREGLVYAAGFLDGEERGLAIYELIVGDEPSLALLGELRPPGPSIDAALAGDGRIYSVDNDRSLLVLDASDPARISETARWRAKPVGTGRMRLTGVALDEVRGLAYLSAWDEGLRVVDVETLTEVGAVEMSVIDAQLAGGTVYAPEFYGGLRVVEGGKVGAPREVGSAEGNEVGDAITVLGDLAVIAHTRAITVYDVSDRTEPRKLARLELPGLAGGIAGVDSYLLIAHDGCRDDSSCRPGLHIVDLSDPRAPQLVSSVPTGAALRDVTIAETADGQRLAYALGDGIDGAGVGLWTFDLSDIENPQAVGYLPLAGLPSRIVVAGEFVLVSADAGGLYVLSPSGWRSTLRQEAPGLVDVVDQVLAGPETLLALTARVQALCSFHGELFELCEERGLGIYDYFEAIIISDLLFCEGCGVPAERPQGALAQIYRHGGVPAGAFWRGFDSSADGTGSAVGVELVAVWTLDQRTRDRISEQWPELTAQYALAFRASLPSMESDVATGFLLFVDPSRDQPISIIEPLNEIWTGFDTARELGRGRWRELYAKQ